MLKNSVVSLPIEIIGQRDGEVLARAGRFVQDHDAIGIRIRQRLEKDGVDDTKGGGVRTDAERKRQDSNERESRRLAELAQSEL